MNRYDVVALGELLIDLTQNGFSNQGNPILEANPGGAPCNVLAALSRLGHTTAFLGKVGRDGFGTQLQNALTECGIDTRGLCFDEAHHTTLAIVHTGPHGARDFSFYRDPGADTMLRAQDLREEMIRSCRIFHFGSLSMTGEPARSATRRALAIAEEAGVLRSFDPNLRPPLWPDLEQARSQILWGLGHCDILKISDNEIQWLTGFADFDAGIRWIQDRFPQIRLLFLTLGPQGSIACRGNLQIREPAFPVDAIETTGAGDTFLAGALHYILQYGPEMPEPHLRQLLRFSNAAAAIITTRRGALRVAPSNEEILELLKEYSHDYQT